jgi:hypothetical protein
LGCGEEFLEDKKDNRKKQDVLQEFMECGELLSFFNSKFVQEAFTMEVSYKDMS